MPIIKSAIKRVKTTQKRQKRNTVTKNKYKVLLKDFTKLVESGNKAEAQKAFPQLQKAIDMAAKRNLIPKNTAGRMKSRLSKSMADEAKTATAKPKKSTAAKEAPNKETASE